MKRCKYSVITGASSGIGYETARAFAKRGKNLIIIARRLEKLEELKSEILQINPKADVIIQCSDLSDMNQVYQVYEETKAYPVETWINNAGFGNYAAVANQDMQKTEIMLRLNIETLTILSTLYVKDYYNVAGTQLINISSAGGYTIVPTAATYCATKFYVSSFTEGLARELTESGALLRAKVLAPAATKTEFGKVANDLSEYDYDKQFSKYHTGEEMSEFLLALYDSEFTVGKVDRETFEFILCDPVFPYADSSVHNQRLEKQW